MMKIRNFVCMTGVFAAMLAAGMSVAGCSDLSVGADGPEPDDGTYMTLRIGTKMSSRSNPSGGEDGDGREPGIRRENDVHSLALFFYDGAAGLDSDAATAFKHKLYLSADFPLLADATVEYKFKLGAYEPADGDRIALAVNVDEDIINKVDNLGTLRRYVVEKTWEEGASLADYDRFTMASARPDDGVVHVIGSEADVIDGSEEHPFRAEASVERTAARIDLRFNKEQITGAAGAKELQYEVPAASGDVNAATLYITNVIPVNEMQKGPWLMKHLTADTVTPGCFDHLNICADEAVDAAGAPTNYVVEPLTKSKNSAVSDEDLNKWYGQTSAGYIKAHYAEIFAGERGKLSPWLSKPELVVEEKDDEYNSSMTVAYVNENIQPVYSHDHRFVTGLLFRAVYVPAVVYQSANLEEVADYRRGETFWLYRPMATENGNGKVLYFSSYDAAVAYAKEHVDDMATISEYTGGVCYYHMWLRHANTDDGSPAYHECCPMEYCVVRNNIYRVAVSFTGPGMVAPDMREPETAVSRIFVRKWNYREQPEILL